uniref:MBD domain-containing protein n=1 Tax=Oryza nivara TaxID=4536 RepID=A0A0E0FUL3_ORYNI
MEGKPSGLPSSTGGKGKGVAVVGANPWHSDDGCDGSKSSSESERTITDDYFGIFVHPGHGDQEVDSLKANRHEADHSETDSERTGSAGFGKIANSAGNSRHFSDVDSGLSPKEKRQKSERFQPERILSGGSEMQTPGANSYGANSGHQRDADSGMFLSFSEKTQVQTNKDIPESWKVHPRKDEVDPDGWVVEIHLRNDQKTKDKYYRHKDYNHKFRSKPEVEYFLNTGKRSADVLVRLPLEGKVQNPPYNFRMVLCSQCDYSKMHL